MADPARTMHVFFVVMISFAFSGKTTDTHLSIVTNTTVQLAKCKVKYAKNARVVQEDTVNIRILSKNCKHWGAMTERRTEVSAIESTTSRILVEGLPNLRVNRTTIVSIFKATPNTSKEGLTYVHRIEDTLSCQKSSVSPAAVDISGFCCRKWALQSKAGLCWRNRNYNLLV